MNASSVVPKAQILWRVCNIASQTVKLGGIQDPVERCSLWSRCLNNAMVSPMFTLGHSIRAVALTMVTLLVMASTVVPSLSYVHKFADHLSQYGGYDARVAALSGFTALYVNPQAPRLPIVLAASNERLMATVLPTPCSMDKTVLPCVAHHSSPQVSLVQFLIVQAAPAGLQPTAARGPPRPLV